MTKTFINHMLALVLTLSFIARFAPTPIQAQTRASVTPSALADSDAAARRATSSQPRLQLANESSARLKGIAHADPLGSAHVPNYVRALAEHTDAAPHFARMMRAFLFEGTLPPETKMAIGWRVANTLKTPYALAHANRWLRASQRGRELLLLLPTADARLTRDERLAITYAERLTRDIHGIDEQYFREVRAAFNDSQVVELTMAVCFFNYFARMCEALALPVEAWGREDAPMTVTTSAVAASPTRTSAARIALISDAEIAATTAAVAAIKEPQKPAAGLGLGIANSQRAMLRVPALALAWRSYGAAVREQYSINRELQLHVSFAVSTANGCRYCTLHQVLGLRRLGVDAAKLVTMRKDDSALTPRELSAVTFARQLTRAPSAVTNSVSASLKQSSAHAARLKSCSRPASSTL